MKVAYTLPNGWVLRNPYPFSEHFMVEFRLEHADHGDHTFSIDRAALASPDSPGLQHILDWVVETTGLTEHEVAKAAWQ